MGKIVPYAIDPLFYYSFPGYAHLPPPLSSSLLIPQSLVVSH
ncbi:hypothetical protein VCHC02A1_1638 [Vibrio cholerae HC-02A1]|nr:hypothetical protein VCHC02A1_1638 [Vibrio cholerae HC-02A1]